MHKQINYRFCWNSIFLHILLHIIKMKRWLLSWVTYIFMTTTHLFIRVVTRHQYGSGYIWTSDRPVRFGFILCQFRLKTLVSVLVSVSAKNGHNFGPRRYSNDRELKQMRGKEFKILHFMPYRLIKKNTR